MIFRPGSMGPAWQTTALAVVLLCLLAPIALLLRSGADLMLLYHESSAYRWGFAHRLLAGEESPLWLPQGYLTSALQKHILVVVRLIFDISKSFPDAVQFFLASTLITQGFMLVIVFIFLASEKQLSFWSKMVVSAVPLCLIFGTGNAGLYYWTNPDYYAAEVVQYTLLATIIAKILASPADWLSRPRIRVLGAICGIMISTKISFVITAPAILIPILISSTRIGAWGRVVVEFFFVLILTVSALIFILYYPNLFALRPAFTHWMQFVSAPGREYQTFAAFYEKQLAPYHYLTLLQGFGIALAVSLVPAIMQRHDWRWWTARIVVILSLSSSIATLALRPAGTTTFEAFGYLAAATAAILASMAPGPARLGQAAFLLLALMMATAVPWETFRNKYEVAAQIDDNRRSIFATLRSAALPTAVLVPDNNHMASTWETFLVKGYSLAPSWALPADRPALDRIFRRFEVRSFQSGVTPNELYAGGELVVWYDALDSAWPKSFPALLGALSRPGSNCREWTSGLDPLRVSVCYVAPDRTADVSEEVTAEIAQARADILTRLIFARRTTEHMLPTAFFDLLPAKTLDSASPPTIGIWGGGLHDSHVTVPDGSRLQIVYPNVPPSECRSLLQALRNLKQLEAIGVEGRSPSWRRMPVSAETVRLDCGDSPVSINFLFR